MVNAGAAAVVKNTFLIHAGEAASKVASAGHAPWAEKMLGTRQSGRVFIMTQDPMRIELFYRGAPTCNATAICAEAVPPQTTEVVCHNKLPSAPTLPAPVGAPKAFCGRCGEAFSGNAFCGGCGAAAVPSASSCLATAVAVPIGGQFVDVLGDNIKVWSDSRSGNPWNAMVPFSIPSLCVRAETKDTVGSLLAAVEPFLRLDLYKGVQQASDNLKEEQKDISGTFSVGELIVKPFIKFEGEEFGPASSLEFLPVAAESDSSLFIELKFSMRQDMPPIKPPLAPTAICNLL